MKKRGFRIAIAILLTMTLLLPAASALIVPAAARITAGTLKSFDEKLLDGLMAPSEHATLNTQNSGGIRFATNINLEKYAALKAFCRDRMISTLYIGTLIAPVEYVERAGEFSALALSQLPYERCYLDILSHTENFYEGEKVLKEGYDAWFVGSIVNLKLENRTRDFAAIGYIQLVLANGSSFYIYSYDNEDMDQVRKYSANLADIATEALDKEGWSEEELEMIQGLAHEDQKLELPAGEVSNLVTRHDQVFFTVKQGAENFYCRLTYDGNNGWRTQVNRVGYNHFRDVGAGQALSLYMREDFDDLTMPLTATLEGDAVKITAKGTETYATLTHSIFDLDFHNPAGDVLYNVNGFEITETGSVKVSGEMNATDAVYGGGERFDSANRRGTSMSLYIFDAYDTAGGTGTYVAIPLFSTSRGGGMFVNRYESMRVSFPAKGRVGDWTLTMDNDVIDFYFYATGDIADVLQAYVDLTGHPSLPSEWAQGYIACRFQPDFQNLNGTSGNADGVTWFYNITDVPGYSNYYYTPDGSTERVRVTADAVMSHKKALTNNTGSTIYYHYIVETDGQDFNYNGILNESYFLRTSTKGGTSGGGIIYIVQSLIDAGMKPTGVTIEGFNWYDVTTSNSRLVELLNIVNYLEEQDIKCLLYMYLAYVHGSAMGQGFKEEYRLTADIYDYNLENGVIGERIGSTPYIPKSDKTDNPDTLGDGTQIYLDITNPEAVKWFMDKIWDRLIQYGVDGVKIDFCESVPNEGYYTNVAVGDRVGGYLKYRWYNEDVFEDDNIHHAYPSYFTSLFYEAMAEKTSVENGGDGFVLFTRGGGIGAQRAPYLWAGDQSRRFANLKTQLAAVINSGISGIPFMTYDMSGYSYYKTAYNFYGGQEDSRHWPEEAQGSIYLPDMQAAEEYESEIFVRGLQFTTFGNTIQTHGDVRHLYQMTDEAQEIAALYNSLHNELADYLQKMSKIACDTGMPMIRHMILEYQNDVNVVDIDNQFMYGDALLVAPILSCNVKRNEQNRLLHDYASEVTRSVYLPAGEWIDLNTGEVIQSTGKTITVTANMAKIPLYLNTASEYAAELQEIFAGETWTAIKALANAQ